MIDIRKLKELVRLMVENDLSELDLQDQEETVAIRRGNAGTVINHQPVIYGGAGGVPAVGAIPAASPARSTGSRGAGEGDSSSDADDSDLVAVESPMVGTFYSAPNPDSGPFVEAGSAVGKETTVCLIEAMKVFNEIKAEVSGTIERVLVENGQAVEFGQRLFLVRPA